MKPINTERIYHHLAYESTYGRRNKEPDLSWGKYKVEGNDTYPEIKKYTLNQIRHSFWTWTGRLCDICLCYLDQMNMPNSIRKISMEPVVASSGA